MDIFTIIVAGGKGIRMNSHLPKQFLRIGEYPVLYYTLKNFYEYDPQMHLILVLPGDQIPMWEEFMKDPKVWIPHKYISGGKSRADSTRNGLAFVPDDCLVVVHDGVRPLVSHDTIKRCIVTAIEKGNAIPVMNIYESLRKIEGKDSSAIDRSKIKAVQTPQVFHSKILKKAFEQHDLENFMDEASIVEKLGVRINLVEGNRENIKITDPFDLNLAEFLVNKRMRNVG